MKTKIRKIAVFYLVLVGILLNVFILWMGFGWPFFFDRWLTVNQPPTDSEVIICLCGGLTGGNLPTQAGWGRIYTAVQLYMDGWGRKVIFSGGGFEKVSEAEVYAEAAGWLGLPEDAVVLDPYPGITAEHPRHILAIDREGLEIGRDTALNIVTSSLHSKRTALCFRKQGFLKFRVITHYLSREVDDPKLVREFRTSAFESYRPRAGAYGGFLFRLRSRTDHFLAAVREAAAIAWYKVKGYI